MATIKKVVKLSGRRWSKGQGAKISSLTQRYKIVLSEPLEFGQENLIVSALPAIGSKHPKDAEAIVQNIDFEEGTGAEANVIYATVNYAHPAEDGSSDKTESAETGQEYQCSEWGWDSSTSEMELTHDVEGTPVVNSAADPFESVPTVSVPTPVFTKVMKFETLPTGLKAYDCKVNSSEVTIGGVACPKRTLLAKVSFKRIWGVAGFNYQVTIQLQKRSNMVKVGAGEGTVREEIGWDVAIVDAGMRETIDGGGVRLIETISKETGRPVVITSPALLDGHGKKLPEGDQPVALKFAAYEEASFPAWFYSEPPFEPEETEGPES